LIGLGAFLVTQMSIYFYSKLLSFSVVLLAKFRALIGYFWSPISLFHVFPFDWYFVCFSPWNTFIKQIALIITPPILCTLFTHLRSLLFCAQNLLTLWV